MSKLLQQGIFKKVSEILNWIYSTHGNTSYQLYRYPVQVNISEFINNCFDIPIETINNSDRMLYEIEGLGNLYIFVADIDKPCSDVISTEFINYDNVKFNLLIIPREFIMESHVPDSICLLYFIVNALVKIIRHNYNCYTSNYLDILEIAPYVLCIDFVKNSTQYTADEITKYMRKTIIFNKIIDKEIIQALIIHPFDIYNILDMGFIIKMKRELDQDGRSN